MGDSIRWPRRDALIKSIDILENFREECKLQLQLGYWVTIDFPSKHHINKILAADYIEAAAAQEYYGTVLYVRMRAAAKHVREYLRFVNDEQERMENKKH